MFYQSSEWKAWGQLRGGTTFPNEVPGKNEKRKPWFESNN